MLLIFYIMQVNIQTSYNRLFLWYETSISPSIGNVFFLLDLTSGKAWDALGKISLFSVSRLWNRVLLIKDSNFSEI